MSYPHAQALTPHPGILGRKCEPSQGGKCCRLPIRQPYDNCLTPPIEIEVSHCIAHRAVHPKAAEDAFIVSEAVYRDWIFSWTTSGGADECGNRGRHPRYCPHAAGD